MSQPDYNMTEYEKYVPYLLGMVNGMQPNPEAVKQFPGAKLFLHLIDQNFSRNNSISFDGTVLKEADAHYYIQPDGSKLPENTKSEEFAAFIAAMLTKMNSRTQQFNIIQDEYDKFPPYMKKLLETLYILQPPSYDSAVATNVAGPVVSLPSVPSGPPTMAQAQPLLQTGQQVQPGQQLQTGQQVLSQTGQLTNPLNTTPSESIDNAMLGGGTPSDRKTFLPINQLGNQPTYFAEKLGIEKIYSDSKWKPSDKNLLKLNASMLSGVGADNSLVSTYISASMGGTGKNLPYELNKFFLKSMIEEEVKLQQQSKGSTTFFETPQSTQKYENIFYRKVGEPGKLFMKNAEGNEVSVQEGSDEFMKLTKQGNCFTTGFVDVDNVTCEQFVSKCLIGQNIRECFAFMKDAHFSNKSIQDVNNMNPSMALRLLKKFGFAIKNVKSDELGVMLDRVDTSSEWIESLKKYHMSDSSSSNKLKSEEINMIAQNTKLMNYLNLVSDKINANPSILNTGYNGPSPTINKEQFKGTTFSKYGMKPKYSFSNESNVASVSSLKSLQNTVVNNRNIVSALYGVPIVGFMAGGSHEQQSKDSYQNLEIAEIFENHFKQFISSLEVNDKTLDPNDKDKVQKLIDELKVLESKLNKARIYTDKYMKLVNVFGHIQNNNVIKFDHIQKFVDNKNNYFQKVNKKQDNLFDILSALANATQQETKVESKPVTAYPDWVRKN